MGIVLDRLSDSVVLVVSTRKIFPCSVRQVLGDLPGILATVRSMVPCGGHWSGILFPIRPLVLA